MRFKTPEDVEKFDREMSLGADALRKQHASRIGIDQSYYEGVHWVTLNQPVRGGFQAGRLPTSYDADSENLRVQTNDLTRNVQKVVAGTRPESIFVDLLPPKSDHGIEAEAAAEAHQALVNMVIESSGFTGQAQAANQERAIAGTWGLGLSIRRIESDPNFAELIAFNFHPTDLILDPHVKDHRLWRHEWVGFETVWTLQKLLATFPELQGRAEQDKDRFKTIGELEPVKINMYGLTGGRLYPEYAQHSRTRGVKVRQWHVRSRGDRFDQTFTIVELPGDGGPEQKVMNFKNAQTPFGGCGMPFVLLKAHWRSQSPASVGMSDASMFRGSQDMINLGETLWHRVQQTYASPPWIVDRGAFKSGTTDEQIKKLFNNKVGNILIINSSGRDRPGANANEPKIAQAVSPQPATREGIERHKSAMREDAHKAPGSFGEVKTHVTQDTFHRALDESGDVTDGRIKADIESYEKLLSVAHGTAVRHVQEKVPNVLGALRREGMDQDGFADLLREDPNRPRFRVKVRDESVRYRSHRQKKEDLQAAVAAKAIDALDFRISMARDQEQAITGRDAQMVADAALAARAVMSGEEWDAIDLGDWTGLFLDDFRAAMLDRSIRNDPEAKARLQRAIDSQRQKAIEVELASDPAIVAQQLQSQQAGPSVAQQEGESERTTLSEMLQGIG